MGEWYEALSGLERFLFLTAVFSTLVFGVQLVFTFFGLGDHDTDTDVSHGNGFSFGDVFTIRNGVSFLMGFSWGGLMAYSWGIEYTIVVAIIGVMVGMVLVAVNMFLLFAMAQLKHDGSIRLENAIDARATVTLPIPARRSGIGKVVVPIQGRLKELHAITDGDALPRNASVIVIDLSGSQLVVSGAAG